jgi:glycosyltransferase involved in cell wall biosynthesis
MNKRDIILSVIIPAYNVSKYISDLLDELSIQILNDVSISDKIEIIVVNDGSTDDTLGILNCYQDKLGDMLLIIDQVNGGVSSARNAGMRAASGRYLYFLDADDKLTSNTMKFYVDTITTRTHEQNIDIFSFGYVSEEEQSDMTKTVDYFWDKYDGELFDRDMVNRLYLSKQICFHIGSTIFQRDFLNKNFIDKNNDCFSEGIAIGEDIEFLLKSLAVTNNLSYHSRVCFRYQIHGDSAMQGYKSYSMKQFQSMELNVKTVDGIIGSTSEHSESDTAVILPRDMNKYYNFFLANSYLSNLRYYLNSETKDKDIDSGFLKYRYLLKKPVSNGDKKRFMVIKMARFVSIKRLLKKHVGE